MEDDATLFSDVVTLRQKKNQITKNDIPDVNQDSFIDSAIGK